MANDLNTTRVEPHGRAALHLQPYVELSDFGSIIREEWLKSFEIRDELFLDEYIIMPNHLHAIVILNDGQKNKFQEFQSFAKPNFMRKPQSISSFIAGFKSAINSKIDDYIDEKGLNIPKYNRNNHFFQPNYYDHIVRDRPEHQRIKKYIINNPKKWSQDEFNSLNAL